MLPLGGGAGGEFGTSIRDHCFHQLVEIFVTFSSFLLLIFSMYAFSSINNQNLQNLWDWNHHNLTILHGRLFFRLNPKLCMSEIHKMWEKTGRTEKPEEGDFSNNGARASCEYFVTSPLYQQADSLTEYPLVQTGKSHILKFKSNVTTSHTIGLTWENYRPPEYEGLISFIIYYKES